MDASESNLNRSGSCIFLLLTTTVVPDSIFARVAGPRSNLPTTYHTVLGIKMPSTISKPRRTEDGQTAKPAAEPRAMPTFVSTLKAEETDFPRGGGTSLTALEVKQTRDEGRREAEAEDRADVSFACPEDDNS